VLYATLPGQTRGTAFKVTEIEPGAGLITPDTTLELNYVFSSWGQVSDKVTFEDVGGLKKEIGLIRELVELPLLFPDIFRQLGINPPRGIVLFGPPGSGKSHLARAIANEINAKFLYINGPDVVSSVYGETEANLRKIFEEASHHLPSIVFIDELDAIAPRRGESGSQSDTRMVAQLLELLDGLKRVEGVMVVGTTNRVESLDKAIRRPGRFDREIFIGPPDSQGRMEILQIHTRGMPLAEGSFEAMKEVGRVTHGFVGADLMELCREAGLNCLRRIMGDRRMSPARFKVSLDELLVNGEDFLKAAGLIRPSALRETITSIPDIGWDDIGGMEPVKEKWKSLCSSPRCFVPWESGLRAAFYFMGLQEPGKRFSPRRSPGSREQTSFTYGVRKSSASGWENRKRVSGTSFRWRGRLLRRSFSSTRLMRSLQAAEATAIPRPRRGW
jgi:transitional endoplasmic reticulum ATPase